ncbi:MAG: protoporphyrinogen IX oxidase [Chitinophagaceae bacterium]|nr:MAG: protoporphyrinogen IX oxidase [Chitinophagaceae bacterium]
MYDYWKGLHIIFIVTWFAGMFYIVRLFIYNREAQDKPEPERGILQRQFAIMIRRLWLGITWPSAILTMILGPIVLMHPERQWYQSLGKGTHWIDIKLTFVIGLYAYFFSLHRIYKQQLAGKFTWSAQKLRVWNEVATIFLVAIVLVVTTKGTFSWLWGLLGLIGFIIVLMSAIKIYKAIRKQ